MSDRLPMHVQFLYDDVHRRTVRLPDCAAGAKWKILQATKIIGQNEADFSKVAVSEKDYKSFCDRNGEMLSPDIEIVCESENAIIGSYCMIDHRGCFFDDSSGQHRYSDPILKIGVEKALQQTVYSFDKFNERKGNY